jgi:hypothetical protein
MEGNALFFAQSAAKRFTHRVTARRANPSGASCRHPVDKSAAGPKYGKKSISENIFT